MVKRKGFILYENFGQYKMIYVIKRKWYTCYNKIVVFRVTCYLEFKLCLNHHIH